MAYQMRDMSGNLWPNRKKQSDKQPDITGKAVINGDTYFISGWRKKTQSGVTWYSLAFKPADDYQQADNDTGEGAADDPGF